MKVGVLGGTFDPVHMGHLIAAEETRISFGLDEVLFVPAGDPWLKAGQKVTDAYHRMAMVELAVGANPYFHASDMEIERPGPTYTVDTVMELRRRYGAETEVYVALGLDLLGQLGKWHRPERIFDLGTVVGLPRPGFEEFDAAVVDAIVAGASAKVKLLKGSLIGINGTELRRCVAEGLSIRYRVPECVEAYIYEHGLYRS